jgi:Ca2+-binding RTX toxin-like protein
MGDTTVNCSAQDSAGNTANGSFKVAVQDTTAPETVIDSGPSGTVSNGSATFAFSASEAGSTFECSLDPAPFSSCASPQSYSNLPNGDHTFKVLAIDKAGNTDASPASRTWTVAIPAGACTITGTKAGETLTGTAGNDVICGGGGNDTIKGLGGNDVLKGEGGADKLMGGAGDDTLDGGSGTDSADYSGSTTGVKASLVTNTSTGEGSDTLASIENLTGSDLNDELTGSGLNNVLSGRSGVGLLSGLDGVDKLSAGVGSDNVTGGAGNDSLVGNGGNDTLKGGADNDSVKGDSGSDNLFGDTPGVVGDVGDDTLDSKDGVNGNDSLDGGPHVNGDTAITDATEKSIIGIP